MAGISTSRPPTSPPVRDVALADSGNLRPNIQYALVQVRPHGLCPPGVAQGAPRQNCGLYIEQPTNRPSNQHHIQRHGGRLRASAVHKPSKSLAFRVCVRTRVLYRACPFVVAYRPQPLGLKSLRENPIVFVPSGLDLREILPGTPVPGYRLSPFPSD